MSTEPLRFERKFLISGYTSKEVEQMVKFHPACFKEIFHERNINNIYFDTIGFDYYYDNVEGSTERLKVRIRWYDNLFGIIKNPILEYKIKSGLLGKKESYPLNPFELDMQFDRARLIEMLADNIVPFRVRNEILSLKPVLLNTYARKYYLSADKNFRITIDKNLTYYRISDGGNTFINKSVDKDNTVLELKYDSDFEVEAKEIGSQLPFAITKNSKYLTGLERVFL